MTTLFTEGTPGELADRLNLLFSTMFGGKLPRIRFGQASVSTSASITGSVPVNHGMGSVPANIVATPTGNNNFAVASSSATSTQFTLTIRHLDNTATTTTVSVFWQAFG